MENGSFYVFGNWKSNKTVTEAVNWYKEFESLWKSQPPKTQNLKIVLCPSYIHLTTLASLIELSSLPISLGVQDVSAFPNGAYTGEVSTAMVSDLVSFTLVGHSERRKYFKEQEADLIEKINRAKELDVEPVYCVQDENMNISENCKFVAYEPVWAIGTGKPDTWENANRVAQVLKSKAGREMTVIYGGSVTHENVSEYLNADYIDGVLPGGASLDPQKFHSLITHATKS